MKGNVANLNERAMLVNLEIRRWSQHTTDQEVSNEVAVAHNADGSMGRYRKRLLPKNALLTYTGVVNSLRREHYFLTLPWSDEGYRILSSTGYFEYQKRINGLIFEGKAALEEFWPKYEQFKAEMKASLNGLYKEEDYPPVDELKAKFGVDIKIKPMPTNKDDFRVKLPAATVKKIQQSIEDDAKQVVENAIKDVYGRLHSVIEHAAERLKAYKVTEQDKIEGRFRDSLVTNIVELLDVIPALNITDDAELNKFAATIRKDIAAHPAQVLRDDEAVRNAVVSKADAILAKMKAFV